MIPHATPGISPVVVPVSGKAPAKRRPHDGSEQVFPLRRHERVLQVRAYFIRRAHGQSSRQLRRLPQTVRDLHHKLDDFVAQFVVPGLQQFHLLVDRRIGHLQGSEAVELGRVDAKRAAKRTATIDRGDELDVRRDGQETVFDRVKDAPRSVQRPASAPCGVLRAAIQLVQKH